MRDNKPRHIEGAPAYRVLVVDDEPDINALVAYHLARAGYRVTTAASGREAMESALLRALLEHEGRVQTRSQLLETVWGAPPDVQTRTVDMHMQRLRHKLGTAGVCIETVRGTGYRFRRPQTRTGQRS